jgi:multidrug efflux pump subunit AcrA (membrane-fusion protein)
MPRFTGYRLLAAFAAALLLPFAASCDKTPPQSGPGVLEWSTAGPGDVMRVVEAQGVIRARDKGFIRVGSRIKGQIKRMHARTGDVVRAGQLLVELDDRELQAQRRQAQARLDAAMNELARVESQKGERLAQAQAALEAEKNRREYAARLNERSQALLSKGHIPRDQADASRRDAAATAQGVAQGKAALERVSKEIEHDLSRARHAVGQAQGLVDEADAYLALTRIVSPIDAIVGQVLTQEGEQVVAELEAVKIFTLIDPRFLELWIFVNEADAAGVRPGMPVRFFMPSRKEMVMAAQVERVSPAPEILDKVLYYPAIALLAPEAGLALRPEMNVQCFVQTDDLKGVLSVPNEAVVARAGKRRVYVDDGQGGARAVEPVLGVRGAARTQVLSGLAAGERVGVKFAWAKER